MKLSRMIQAAGMFLFLGAMVPLSAQSDHQGEKGRSENKGQGGHQRGSEGQSARPAPQQDRQAQQAQQPQQRAQQPQRIQQQQPQRAERPQQQPQQPQRAQQQPQRAQQQQPQRADQFPQRQRQDRQPQQVQPQQVQRQTQYQPQASRIQQPTQQRQQALPQQPERARAWQQQRGWQQPGTWRGHDSWQQNRAQHWVSDHRTWSQRGGYGGYYIPQDRFRASFGSQHLFRIRTRPVIYMGYPRFYYGGFSFLMVDPWPEYWADDWYYNNDVYIAYDDGYYLCNPRYPQVRLAVTVLL